MGQAYNHYTTTPPVLNIDDVILSALNIDDVILSVLNIDDVILSGVRVAEINLSLSKVECENYDRDSEWDPLNLHRTLSQERKHFPSDLLPNVDVSKMFYTLGVLYEYWFSTCYFLHYCWFRHKRFLKHPNSEIYLYILYSITLVRVVKELIN